MKTCPACGLENPPDRDFCSCGEYLRWEPTGFMEAVAPPPAPQATSPQPASTPAGPGPGAASPAAGIPPPPVRSPSSAPPEPSPAGPPPAELASITLRPPEDAPAGVDGVALGVEPGDRAVLRALVRNQSGIVDNYELAIDGLPAEWVTVAPATVYLVPFGSGGSYEQEVEIHLHPPRTATAEARLWELAVVARSKAHEATAAAAPFVLGIQPFEEHGIDISPDRAGGRRKAGYDITLENRANGPARLALGGSDPDGAFRFAFEPPVIELEPGQSAPSRMTVRPPKQIWLGRPHEHRLEVLTAPGDELPEGASTGPGASGGGGKRGLPGLPNVPGMVKPRVSVGPAGLNVHGPRFGSPAAGAMGAMRGLDLAKLKPSGGRGAPPMPAGPLLPTQVVFRQKAWLPWWMVIVVPMLAAAALLLFLLVPRTVEVPDLSAEASVFEAEKALTEAGLKLKSPAGTKVDAAAAPGAIIDQTPKAGEKAEKDSEVSLLVAVGTGEVAVPKITGLTTPEAEKALREVKLALGQASPQPPDPKGRIRTQIPLAKERVKEGTPVDIFLPDPKGEGDARAGGGGGAGGGAAGGGGGGGGGGGSGSGSGEKVVVPPLDPPEAKAYAAAAAKLGLAPEAVNAFSKEPTGEIFGTDPAPGTEVAAGSTVKLLISAGFPELAFDDGKDVLLVDGATGKKLPAVAKGSEREKDATFSPDGSRIAYRSGDQLMLADRGKPDDPALALTEEGDEFSDPAFAPTAEANVLAAIRRSGEKSALCVGEVTAAGYDPTCLPGTTQQQGSVVRWAADGRTIFVPSVDAKTGRFGMLRYSTRTAFSSTASDWEKGRLVTDVSKPGKGVKDLSISPDGKQMAVVANLDAPGFRLYLAKPGDFKLSKAKPLPVRACKATWRTDGRELAVVQADEGCTEGVGTLVRIPLATPTEQTSLKVGGDDPAYEPLVLPGG